MIPEDMRLYPQYITSDQMYFDDEPYAYWLSAPEYNVYEWVLYKEYNDYESVVGNGGLQGVSYEELMNSFRTYTFYEGMDREKLCRTFRQRSLGMTLEESRNWKDFVEE